MGEIFPKIQQKNIVDKEKMAFSDVLFNYLSASFPLPRHSPLTRSIMARVREGRS
jgi:hypothetical protein